MEKDAEYGVICGDHWLEVPSDLKDGGTSGTLSAHKADLWALVLQARNMPCRTERHGSQWSLLTTEERYKEALNELRHFEDENRNWPPVEPEASPLVENTLATLSVLVLLASFHNITLLDSLPFGLSRVDWVAVGGADSTKILDGQWWRSVTALTLHADWLHLSGNLAIGGIFIVFLCRDLGSGLAWALLIGSGVLGNLANAWMQPFDHNSVGASTLVFGAVGILAATNLLRHRYHMQKRRAMPVAAALGLLALLGTEGKNTDLGAHLFGFVFGFVLGLAAEYAVGKFGRPDRGFNALLALSCIGLTVTAWWAALN